MITLKMVGDETERRETMPPQGNSTSEDTRRKPSYPTVPGTRVVLLTDTSKMPGQSWSIPAGRSCPFSVFEPGSICNACYADPDEISRTATRYSQPVVRNAQKTRFDWVRRCLKTDEGTEEFISTMVNAIGRLRGGKFRELRRQGLSVSEASRRAGPVFFRIHDSGDFFNERYTRAWIEIARRLPRVRFWAPTRSHKAPWMSALVDLNSLPNVSVRPSADFFDEAPPTVDGLDAGTTAIANLASLPGTANCPAPSQGGECRNCRTCWVAPTTSVAYHQH